MNPLIVQLQGAQIKQGNSIILDQVNLRIHAGEFTYLIGRTGSGKSSLLKTLYGVLPLETGTGEVAGYDLCHLNRRSIPGLRRKLGIVFQDFMLLTDRSVASNLEFALRATGWSDQSAIDQRIGEALADVGLSDHRYKMPHQLSGGEQQRVVIARALINHPSLIIADEPTGNLDPETSDEILLLLRKLSRQNNAAVLFATHDYRMLENFPARIIRCTNGHLFDDQEVEI
ncbi:MAG: cell division ATP-binding protein FtsE [Haliscomenobacter sp.]